MLHRIERQEDEVVDALVCPLAGRTDNEVLELLKKHGALKTEVLSSGFISVKAAASVFRALESIAAVHRKAVKQILS